MIKNLFLILMLLVPASVACASSVTAASCNYPDVNAVINGPTHTAVAGDVVNIPAGTCTWTSSLSITVAITLQGAGTPNTGTGNFGSGTTTTIIVDNVASSSPMITVTGITFGQTMTVALLDIEPFSNTTALQSPLEVAGTCTASGCPNLRVDNIIFGATTQWTEGGNSSQADTMMRMDNVFGVLDHNTLPTGSAVVFANISHSAYLGVGAFGDNSWATADSFGGANNMFLENNSVYVGGVSVTDAEFAPSGGGIGGTRQVGRYNHITSDTGFGGFGFHGLDTDGRPRSGRQIEAYGNTITCTNSSCNILVGYRGGTGYTHDNTFINSGTGFFNSFIALAVYRSIYGPSPWGYCGGLNANDPWDTNDNTVLFSGTMSTTGSGVLTMTDSGKSFGNLVPSGGPYSVFDTKTGQNFVAEIASNTATTITITPPITESAWTGFNNGDTYEIIRSTVCADQAGRGQGISLSGSTPSPSSPVNEALDPIYEWNDSMSPVRLNGNVGTNTGRTIANRDWYTDGSNGTPVMQTSPTSPFTGATGVGIGTLANRPTSCTPGVGYAEYVSGSFVQLDKCTGANTWTSAAYTVYAYPHPLIAGSVQASASTCSPGTGTYVATQTPACTNPNAGTTVQCYTTNGTTPATNGLGTGCTTGTSLTSGGTVSVSSTTTLSIIAGTSTALDSSVNIYFYTISSIATSRSSRAQ